MLHEEILLNDNEKLSTEISVIIESNIYGYPRNADLHFDFYENSLHE